MTDILNAKKKKLADLEAGNQRTYNELQKATGGRYSIDFDSARRESLIDHLVKWGIITEEQKVDFDIDFHGKVEEALKKGFEEFREMQKRDRGPKLVVPGQRSSKLVDPKTGKPLGS